MAAYLFYRRDKPGTAELRVATRAAHCAFMDEYADVMIARGPTLTDDGETVTGSLHLVDLPDAEAAQVFAFEEPYYRAGVFSDVLVRRWRNAAGRTMWDFTGDNQRFLIIGHAGPGMTQTHDALIDHNQHYFVNYGYQKRIITGGPMLSDDGNEWLGSVMLIEMPDRTAVEMMLAGVPYARCGLYSKVEIHRWRFGGNYGVPR